MSIASRVTSITGHLEDAYEGLRNIGADLTGIDKNIDNIADVLDDIYDDLPKVTDEDTSITLDNTRVGKLETTLKGNTSQTGTPTPSSPVPVNVVSGDNSIEICGKNLFGFNLTAIDTTATYRPTTNQRLTITGTDNPNEVKFNFTNGNYARGYFEINGIDGTLPYTITFVVKENTTNYTPTAVIDTNNSTNKKLVFSINGNNGNTSVSSSNYFILSNIQLEKGSSATNYEPYQGNTYNIDLPVENLWGGLSSSVSRSVNSVDFVNNSDGSISVNGTASANSYSLNGSLATTNNHYITLKAGTYTISGSASDCYLQIYDTSDNIIGITGDQTFTLNQETNVFIRVEVRKNTEVDNITIYPMLCKGSNSNTYTPYGTTPIEMCKIGDYQDYFYKDSDKWYISQAIIKRVYNGTENWSKSSNTSVDRFLKGEGFPALTGGYCDKYPVSNNVNTEINRLFLNAGTQVVINFSSYGTTTLEQFKTWLSSNNVTLYFVRTSSIAIEITYQPLIDQLNLLEKAMSKENQTNISQVNNDLPFIISASALKEWSDENE